jgi:hypothetical protein
MGKVYQSPAGIASYANLLEPRKDESGKLYYSVTVLFSKVRSAELDALRKIALAVATEKWGEKGKHILANAKYPVVKDGDKKIDEETGKVKPGYAGMLFISAKVQAPKKPKLFDAQMQEVFDDSDETGIYSGCMVRIVADAYAYEYQGNKGVSLGLSGVQVLKRLPRIDGRTNAAEVFTPWTEEVADPLA